MKRGTVGGMPSRVKLPPSRRGGVSVYLRSDLSWTPITLDWKAGDVVTMVGGEQYAMVFTEPKTRPLLPRTSSD